MGQKQSAAKTYDIEGKTFNNIKVLKYSHKEGYRKMFEVLCLRCNTTSFMRMDRFTGKHKLECCSNCRQEHAIQKSKERATTDTVINTLMYSYKCNADSRNLPFKLTREEFKKIIEQNCYYCNSVPIVSKTSISINKTDKLFKHNGIDKIDNTKGYIKNNIVPCCSICNVMKNNLSIEEFKTHILKISKVQRLVQ